MAPIEPSGLLNSKVISQKPPATSVSFQALIEARLAANKGGMKKQSRIPGRRKFQFQRQLRKQIHLRGELGEVKYQKSERILAPC